MLIAISSYIHILLAAATDCPWFPGPRDKNEFKSEMKEVLRTTKQRFRYSAKKSRSSISETDKSQDGDHNLTLAEIEQKLKQLQDLGQEDEEESEDYDADRENFEESGEDWDI